MSSRYDKYHLARKDSVVFILALRLHFYLAGKKFNYRRIRVVEGRKILLVVSTNRFDIFHRLREGILALKMETSADTNPKHPSAIDFIVFCADEQYFDLIIEDEQFQTIAG